MARAKIMGYGIYEKERGGLVLLKTTAAFWLFFERRGENGKGVKQNHFLSSGFELYDIVAR